jgi:hypothetical protein
VGWVTIGLVIVVFAIVGLSIMVFCYSGVGYNRVDYSSFLLDKTPSTLPPQEVVIF